MSSDIERHDNPKGLDQAVVNREPHIRTVLVKPETPENTLLALIFIFMHQIFPYKGILNSNTQEKVKQTRKEPDFFF